MRTADGRRGGRVAPGFSAVYVAGPVLLTDGTNPDRVSGIGVLAVAGASLLLGWALVGGGWPRLGAAGWAFLGGLLGLVIWTGASVFWSVVGDRSWDYLNLGLIYLAFAVVGVLAGAAGPWAVRWAAGALAAALGAAMLWALAGKVVPGLDPEGDFRGRVRGTVDYWNAFALLTAWGLLAGLWLARSAETRRRVAGALLVYGSTLALLLTFSRGGLVVAGLAVAAWVLLVPGRLESLAALAAGALPALGVAALGFVLDGVSRDEQPRDVRVDDGVLFGLALAAGAGVVVLAVCLGSAAGSLPLARARTAARMGARRHGLARNRRRGRRRCHARDGRLVDRSVAPARLQLERPLGVVGRVGRDLPRAAAGRLGGGELRDRPAADPGHAVDRDRARTTWRCSSSGSSAWSGRRSSCSSASRPQSPSCRGYGGSTPKTGSPGPCSPWRRGRSACTR